MRAIFLFIIISLLFSGCVRDIDEGRDGGYIDDAPRTDVGVQLSIADIIDANGQNFPLENSVQSLKFNVQGNPNSTPNSNIINRIAPLDVDTSRIENIWVFQFGRKPGSATNVDENSWVLIGNPGGYSGQVRCVSMPPK